MLFCRPPGPPRPPRPLSVLASALAAAGIVLAVAGCGHVTPLGPGSAPASLPPSRQLRFPITMQVMRSRVPTTAGQCPSGTVEMFGSALVPRATPASQPAGRPVPVNPPGSTATRTTTTTPAPAATPAGLACYLPAGSPVTVSSAAVSSVATYPPPSSQPDGPATYGFVVAFPAADVPPLTALIRQAYAGGDALGVSVDGLLWQAPQPQTRFVALRAEQIRLLSRDQAVQLHRLLVASG